MDKTRKTLCQYDTESRPIKNKFPLDHMILSPVQLKRKSPQIYDIAILEEKELVKIWGKIKWGKVTKENLFEFLAFMGKSDIKNIFLC